MENGFSATFQATADLSALLWKKAGGHLRQALPGIIDASGEAARMEISPGFTSSL